MRLETELPRLLSRQDLTMEELVETADTLVKELAPKQTRYKVTERPDARTVRYYVTQALLPKPVSYEGGRARYGGAHLLRLLWIKKLQAEHLTLSKIAQVLEGKSDEELLRALKTPEPEAPKAEPMQTTPPPPVDLPSRSDFDRILRDPDQRLRLAENLEALAAWLRHEGES